MADTGSPDNTDGKRLLEAALFMASEPLELERLSKIVGISSLGYLKGILTELEHEYKEKGFHLRESSEGWMFQVDGRFLPHVASLTPYSDLPEGEKRTLALVAYKEPLMQAEVIKTQGNKAYTYIKHLAKRGLIRAEKQGRTKSLSLTQEFERYFGENKEAIKERLIAKINREEKEI
ncbi:MAG: SMC-Scp complex subunit ScpB [Candidatus Aenigmarchaeota archaeon]|nr:SMC-Scp complex subunit ScpB [Candidatus Aenigmarchaeota archaeon]